MIVEDSKANDDLAYFHRRIDAIRMSEADRMVAKARLARAEVMASVLAAIVHGIARMAQSLTRSGSTKSDRAPGQSAPSIG